eukprot:3934042-Rhodomonas_salina.1
MCTFLHQHAGQRAVRGLQREQPLPEAEELGGLPRRARVGLDLLHEQPHARGGAPVRGGLERLHRSDPAQQRGPAVRRVVRLERAQQRLQTAGQWHRRGSCGVLAAIYLERLLDRLRLPRLERRAGGLVARLTRRRQQPAGERGQQLARAPLGKGAAELEALVVGEVEAHAVEHIERGGGQRVVLRGVAANLDPLRDRALLDGDPRAVRVALDGALDLVGELPEARVLVLQRDGLARAARGQLQRLPRDALHLHRKQLLVAVAGGLRLRRRRLLAHA